MSGRRSFVCGVLHAADVQIDWTRETYDGVDDGLDTSVDLSGGFCVSGPQLPEFQRELAALVEKYRI